ncbi:RYamide receptor-like [Orbicella faveolata]|uniref:RYamide receptor-like n=1 Tax=Orbicella faveolata TaxID=48498 RepID=UPI0009E4DBB8|nr:RYamide receptor-like [Orbicella faveolata]
MHNRNGTNFSCSSPTNSSTDAGGSQTQIQQTQAILAVIYYIMATLSLVGNTVVIKAIRRIGKTLRRQVHYLFIVNLSVADLLFAVEMIPMICVHMLMNSKWHIKGRFGQFLCQFDVFLSAVLILTSNLTILAIAVEKFLGIFFPMKTFVSKKRAYFIIVSTWLVSGLYSAPLFVFAHLKVGRRGTAMCAVCLTCEEVVKWFIFQTILLAMGFFITLTLYSAIGVRIWLHKTPGFQLQEVQRGVQAKKHKALKMLATLVFVFYVSFIPFWISQLSVHFGFYDKLGPYYNIISAFLMLCNGTANPVIYSVFNLDIRDEFKSLITCKTSVERRQSLQSRSFRNRAIRKRKYEDLELNTSPQPSPMITLRSNNNFKVVTGQQNAAFVFEDTRL